MNQFVLVVVTLFGLLAWPAVAEETPAPVFSGQVTTYSDSFNGYKLDLPNEFSNTNKGSNSIWSGPMVDDFATTVHVNATPMAGVHPQALYDAILRSKKEDRNLTAIATVKMPGKLKGKPIYGFTCHESDFKPGTRDLKDPSDHHRWFLFVWGNDTAYEVMVAGSFKSLGPGAKTLPPVYTQILKSFGLIVVK